MSRSMFAGCWLAATLIAGASPAQPQSHHLRNDSGEPYSCRAIAPFDGIAAIFTASPSQYPYDIHHIRVLSCAVAPFVCHVTIYRDDGVSLLPGPVLHDEPNEFLVQTGLGWQDLPLSSLVTVPSGFVRVLLVVTSSSEGRFTTDLDGIITGRNFIFNQGFWRRAETQGVPGDWVLQVGISPNPLGVERPTAEGVSFELAPNRPNPFRSSTRIPFTLASAREVTVEVFDASGRRVAQLLDRQPMDPGPHEVAFDAAGLPTGIYSYRVIAGVDSKARRMLVLR